MTMKYPESNTALLLIDPLNDFLSPFGKLSLALRRVSKAVNLMANLREVLELARKEGLQVAYAPHHKFHKGSFADRRYLHPSQYMQGSFNAFAKDAFGGRFHKHFRPREGDIIASEHACSSGFIGTDLHAQLQERNITHLILAGLLSNTCVESTARSAVDLGYHVTLLPDCASTWTPADHKAAVAHSYRQLGHQVSSISELKQAFVESGVANA